MFGLNISDVGAYLPSLVGASALYLVPLIFSRRARKSHSAAAGIVVGVMILVFLLVSVLYPLGAGLVGPLSWQTYFWSVSFYLMPGIVILPLWVVGMKLLGEKAD